MTLEDALQLVLSKLGVEDLLEKILKDLGD
jgi:hypothetical protein